jgi:hypothetical protein
MSSSTNLGELTTIRFFGLLFLISCTRLIPERPTRTQDRAVNRHRNRRWVADGSFSRNLLFTTGGILKGDRARFGGLAPNKRYAKDLLCA